MEDSSRTSSEEDLPAGFWKYICRTCQQRTGVESSENGLMVRCGQNLIQAITRKQISRHKDCPHLEQGKLLVGHTQDTSLKKLAKFARHQKKKLDQGKISTEVHQARIKAYETRLSREMSRI